MNGYFIDKLNMMQKHQHRLPVIGENGFVRVDLESGFFDMDNIIVKHRKIEGSYSSSVLVRCNGFTVTVQGNPSRWGRVDNLFGFNNLDACVSVYNAILLNLGLPPFTKCRNITLMPSRTDKHSRVTDGAIITHIDWTQNLSVGYGNEQQFIKALATMSVQRSVKPYLYADLNTVEWYSKSIQGKGSSFRYLKCYAKAADMIKRRKERVKNAEHDAHDYYDYLTKFVIDQGIVREEHSLKSKLLAKHRLNFYGEVIESDFVPFLNDITDIRKKLEVTHMNYETIAEQLLDAGICNSRQSANSTMSFYMLWCHGHEIDKSKRQYREHKARLKQIGIDISVKLDITRSPIRLKSAEIIEVKPLTLHDMPSWYKRPLPNAAGNVTQFIQAA